MNKISLIVLLVIFIILRVIISVYKKITYQIMLLNNGRYQEFISYMSERHNKYYKQRPHKCSCLLGIANCYSRMGNFQESINYLKKIDYSKINKAIKSGYFLLYSLNLYFLNENLDKAVEFVNESRVLLDTPESMLLKALIELELGKIDDANKLVEEYFSKINRKKIIIKFAAIVYFDNYITNVIEKYMLGLYYMKMLNMDKAKSYFCEAANCNYKSYFSDKAKALSI